MSADEPGVSPDKGAEHETEETPKRVKPPELESPDAEPEDAGSGFDVSRVPGYTVPAILLGVPLLAWLIGLVIPAFYDHVIWQYYWGPIKADAAGRVLMHNGVSAEPGYNLVNTISWAGLMGVCILGITQIVDALRVRVNNTVIFGATSWVVTGAVWHVLEDTDLMLPPLQYIFITPPIYLLFGAFGILGILTGVYMQRTAQAQGLDQGLQKLWLVLTVGILVYVLAWVSDWSQVVSYLNPLTVALLAALTYFVVRWRVASTGRIDPGEVMFILSLWPFVMSLAYVMLFLEEPWSASGEGLPMSVWMAPLLAGLTAAAARYVPARATWGFIRVGSAVLIGVVGVLLIGSLGGRFGFEALDDHLNRAIATAVLAVIGGIVIWRKSPALQETVSALGTALRSPINLLIIFSQMVDGYATSLGLDLAGYREKHVLSAALIDSFREYAEDIGWTFGAEHPTFLAFAPVKLLISLLVIYAIDIYSKEDAKRYPSLIGFVKFAIIMVGIGPGVRDFVRLGLGV